MAGQNERYTPVNKKWQIQWEVATILWPTDTYAHIFWIFSRMLQSNFSNLFGGRVDFCMQDYENPK